MEDLNEAYCNVKHLINELANSSAGEYVACKSDIKSFKPNRSAWYAEQDDNYLDVLIDNDITKKLLHKVVDKRYGNRFNNILQYSINLRNDSFPLLFSVYNKCCDTLGIYDRPEVYVTNCMTGINALTMEVCGQAYILIGRDVVSYLDCEEQSFLIGHELGHYQQGNLVCHTVYGLFTELTKVSEVLGAVLADAMELPLKRWFRQSEFNADRAGYLCCGEISVIKQLFSDLGMIQHPNEFSLYRQLSEEHPLLATRLQRLYSFADRK